MNGIMLAVVIVCVIGVLSAVILTVAAKFMSVPVDERVGNMREVLPGANCGACGYAGCDEYAVKLVFDGVKGNLCTPGGQGVAAKIASLLGISAEGVEEKSAFVKCAGTTNSTKYIMEYQGIKTCEACNSLYQGRASCSHACLGYGDCIPECQYGAIYIQDGVAVVDKQMCTGCGMCVKKCPNNLIVMLPSSNQVRVCCDSTDKGAYTRNICSAGCIGCKLCQKKCQFDAITITDNLASIDPAKCTNCGECIAVCPTGVIKN